MKSFTPDNKTKRGISLTRNSSNQSTQNSSFCTTPLRNK